MAIWSRLFSGIFGVGVGIAAADAVEPVVEVAKQEAWAGNANRVLEMDALAGLLAQGLTDLAAAQDQALRQGFDADKLAHVAALAQTAPDVQQAMHMWRLGEADFDDVVHALRKAGIEPRWYEKFSKQRTLPLAPADLANAVQQGFVPGAGLLNADSGPGPPYTPPVDEIPLKTLDEFVAGAVDDDHAKVLSQLVGLPPGVIELLDLWNRGEITETAVEHGIREGHTKTKWTEPLKALRHFLISPAEAATLRLKGWKTKEESDALGALRGASPEVMELLYLARGRPAAPGQMATAAFRGIDGPDGVPMNEAQFLKGIRESDIRPEWGPMLWGARYHYPPLFQLNRLVQAGAVPVATAVEWATKEGYAPEVVTVLEAFWSQAAGPTATPLLNSAKRRLYTTAHNSYISGLIDDAVARGALTTAGASEGEIEDILAVWSQEKALPRKALTPAQIKKAYKDTIFDFPTALGMLEDLGYDAADARTYLEE